MSDKTIGAIFGFGIAILAMMAIYIGTTSWNASVRHYGEQRAEQLTAEYKARESYLVKELSQAHVALEKAVSESQTQSREASSE